MVLVSEDPGASSKSKWTFPKKACLLTQVLQDSYRWNTNMTSHFKTYSKYTWRRKWQPLHCSCLENPRDGGAWWATISGVAQSWTRLKRLSSSSSSSKYTILCDNVSRNSTKLIIYPKPDIEWSDTGYHLSRYNMSFCQYWTDYYTFIVIVSCLKSRSMKPLTLFFIFEML